MLVLSRAKDERIVGYVNVGALRKALESLHDGEDVQLFDILVSRFNGDDPERIRVRLGFECPRIVKVMRSEVLDRQLLAGEQQAVASMQ